jgi:hypothetical protein
MPYLILSELEREHRIRQRAHELWIMRGKRDGFDLEDWQDARFEIEYDDFLAKRSRMVLHFPRVPVRLPMRK